MDNNNHVQNPDRINLVPDKVGTTDSEGPHRDQSHQVKREGKYAINVPQAREKIISTNSFHSHINDLFYEVYKLAN